MSAGSILVRADFAVAFRFRDWAKVLNEAVSERDQARRQGPLRLLRGAESREIEVRLFFEPIAEGTSAILILGQRPDSGDVAFELAKD